MVKIPNYFKGGLIPVSYDIWLQSNGTRVQVPNNYLATNNPPSVPSMHSGFFGLNLPMAYVTVTVVVMALTAVAGISYLLLTKKRRTRTS